MNNQWLFIQFLLLKFTHVNHVDLAFFKLHDMQADDSMDQREHLNRTLRFCPFCRLSTVRFGINKISAIG